MKVHYKTLEKVAKYLDAKLNTPLSIDDMLYMRFKIENELFSRRVEQMRKQLWDQWNKEYLVRFRDGFYEQGQLVKKSEIK